MFWWIITIAIAVLFVVLAILEKELVPLLGLVIPAFILLVLWGATASNKIEIRQLEQTVNYIQENQPDNMIEDAALTAKKVEVNSRIITLKESYNAFGIWFSLIPSEIEDLELLD